MTTLINDNEQVTKMIESKRNKGASRMRATTTSWARFFALTAAIVWISAASGRAQISHKVLLHGADIHPIVGEPIKGGSILVENGKIVAVGKDVKAPFDAKVIDATGKVIIPGLVTPYTSTGLDRANESADVGAFLNVFDAIDPSDTYFQEALRSGVTTTHVSQGLACVISGVSRVLRPVGITVDEMTVRADLGMVVAFGPKPGLDRASQLAVLRRTWKDLDRYLELRAEQLYEADLKKKDEELLVGPEEARKLGKELVTIDKLDDQHRNLELLRRGKFAAFGWCALAMDIAPCVDMAKQQGFHDRLTLWIGSDCHKAARSLRKIGRPVVLPTSQFIYSERDRLTGDVEQSFVPKVLHDAGLEFAITGGPQPLYDAARLVRNGVPRNVALQAVTINAARALGMADRLGSIEKGKDGNFVVLSGDPFDLLTWVEEVYIEGHRVYEKSKDVRLRDVIQGAYDTDRKAADKKAAEAKKSTEKDDKKSKKSSDKPADSKAPKSDSGQKKN